MNFSQVRAVTKTWRLATEALRVERSAARFAEAALWCRGRALAQAWCGWAEMYVRFERRPKRKARASMDKVRGGGKGLIELSETMLSG